MSNKAILEVNGQKHEFPTIVRDLKMKSPLISVR